MRTKSGLIVLMCIGLAAGFAIASQAATLHVPLDYDSIQAAIDAAGTGDVVVVAEGTYDENINFNGKAITVRSTDPTDPVVVAGTTIDGQQAGHVVTFNSGEGFGSVLKGFTITNGRATYGAGIYCTNASPTIWSNTISENSATPHNGGGIYCGDDSSPSIENNTISDNTAHDGGGIYCNNSSPAIQHNVMTSNFARGGGGAIRLYVSSSVIQYNAITNNTAVLDGGGMCLWACFCTIENNTVAGNSAGRTGGGIHYNVSPSTVQNNTITNNFATSDGGGIFCLNSSSSVSTISSNTMTGNTTAANGGGMYLCNSPASIENDIISGNTADEGGGIYVASGSPTVIYCDAYGNTGGNYGGMPDPTGTNGNVSEDPLFADPGSDDYHLKSRGGRWNPSSSSWVTDAVHSPCIDGGDPASDYSNERGPNGDRLNMGAYGNTAEASKSEAGGPCALAWLETGGFQSDGVDPDRGSHLAWYTFKVRYTGGDPNYVRLHLFRYGVEVVGSPCQMSAESGDPATGQTFSFQRRLCKGTYTYYFSASYGTSHATGDPTQEQIGPVCHNRPPRLEWTGYGEWEWDPVDPQGRNLPGTEFTWKVKYIDREGDAPEHVRVHIARRSATGEGFADEEIEDSPFDMSAEGTDYMNGAVFTYSRVLNSESRYVCWFSAKEQAPEGFDSNDAYGVPSWWRRNMVWVFNAPPRLRWSPGPNFGGDDPPDGLHPNEGNAGDTFTFKVQYRDQEATEPEYVHLHLLKWNGLPGEDASYDEIPTSPYDMTTDASEFDIADYSVQVQINAAGRYRYYFSANDGDKEAIGEPSWHRMLGPVVNGAGSAAATLTSLACTPTPAGAQVTFTLSAEAAVTVEVLNIAGRLVKQVVLDRPMTMGTNTLTWNGRSARGLLVPSGVYLVRVTAAGESGARRQVLGTLHITR